MGGGAEGKNRGNFALSAELKMLLVSQACQLLMLFFRAADLCRSFCRNSVYSQSGLKFADAGALAFFCVEIQAEDSFSHWQIP